MSSELSTWQVLSARRATRSLPGARRDDARVALVIEGGGNRSAYSAGMAMAVEEAGLVDAFDDVYGTSGGALNGAWLLTGEGTRWLPLWATEEYAQERVADPRRLFRGGPLVDLKHLLHHVYVHVAPMAFERVVASPVRLHPIATDCRTGRSVDLASTIVDTASLQRALRASASLPLLAGRPVRTGGSRYVDGGVAEPVPVHTALAHGATHVLVLRSRREAQPVAPPSRLERAVMGTWMAAFAPGARETYRRRHLAHEADEAVCGSGPSVAQVRPGSSSPDVARLTNDLGLVAGALEEGRNLLARALSSNGVT